MAHPGPGDPVAARPSRRGIARRSRSERAVAGGEVALSVDSGYPQRRDSDKAWAVADKKHLVSAKPPR